MQVPSGQEAGAEDVQCAADLAAYFSKARGEKRAPVIVASPADLKRPKGSRPGQVSFFHQPLTCLLLPPSFQAHELAVGLLPEVLCRRPTALQRVRHPQACAKNLQSV